MEARSFSPADLAIVIPAFRGRFLGRTLTSLAAQTDRRFRVYVADDGSPEDLAAVVAPFRGRLALEYRRFEDNCGRGSLIAHWRRAVALTQEPWVWLLPDDDEAEPGCVEAWQAARAQPGAAAVKLYRFDLDLIDEAGVVYRRLAAQPREETAVAMATALVSDHQREWRVSNHVFARSLYDERGGFPEFPLALFSDYAAWMEFALPAGVRTAAGARVRWRHHGDGLSSMFGGRHRGALLAALQAYAGWLTRHAGRMEPAAGARFRAQARAHVIRMLGLVEPPLSWAEIRAMHAGLRAAWGGMGGAERRALAVALVKGRLRGRPVFRWLAGWRLRRTLAGRG